MSLISWHQICILLFDTLGYSQNVLTLYEEQSKQLSLDGFKCTFCIHVTFKGENKTLLSHSSNLKKRKVVLVSLSILKRTQPGPDIIYQDFVAFKNTKSQTLFVFLGVFTGTEIYANRNRKRYLLHVGEVYDTNYLHAVFG